MKLSVPVYFVALAATFVYGLLKGFFPDLPFTTEQIMWLFLTILAALGVDVTQAVKQIWGVLSNQGLLPKK